MIIIYLYIKQRDIMTNTLIKPEAPVNLTFSASNEFFDDINMDVLFKK